MPYHIEIRDEVEAYLRDPQLGLSPEDADNLISCLNGLAETGDFHRHNPVRSRPPDSNHFEMEYIIEHHAGRWRRFRFSVFDDAIVYGELQVGFAEEL